MKKLILTLLGVLGYSSIYSNPIIMPIPVNSSGGGDLDTLIALWIVINVITLPIFIWDLVKYLRREDWDIRYISDMFGLENDYVLFGIFNIFFMLNNISAVLISLVFMVKTFL